MNRFFLRQNDTLISINLILLINFCAVILNAAERSEASDLH